MSDEEIIKKRLLIDGDGTGDDRRITVVLKHFLKWTNSKSDSPESNQMSYDRLLAHLAQSQFAVAKSEYISEMIDEELKNYATFTAKIERSIEIAKREIEDSKKELDLAKQIRKNKMEYDLLAKLIKEQPDRKETTSEIEALKKELNQLLEKKFRLERKFQKRRNDFTLLMYCASELESQLLDSSSESEKSDDEEDKDETVEELRMATGGVVTTANMHLSTNGVVGAMDVSDDEQIEASSSKSKRRKRDRDYCKELDEEESKGPMSLEEDTVLELSIDKEESDAVKLG